MGAGLGSAVRGRGCQPLPTLIENIFVCVFLNLFFAPHPTLGTPSPPTDARKHRQEKTTALSFDQLDAAKLRVFLGEQLETNLCSSRLACSHTTLASYAWSRVRV